MSQIKDMLKKMKIKPTEVFQSALDHELYGGRFFEAVLFKDYNFRHSENQNSAWLISGHHDERPYTVSTPEDRSKREDKLPMRVIQFEQCELVDFRRLDERDKDYVVGCITKCAKSLAVQINEAFIKVLSESVRDEFRISVKGQPLDETMALMFSDAMKRGFHLDKFVFPHHLEDMLVVREIITRDDNIDNSHYVGKTKTGQDAFWSEHLNDTALLFDSSYGEYLTEGEPQAEMGPSKRGAAKPEVCGWVEVNAIVKNVASVVALCDLVP